MSTLEQRKQIMRGWHGRKQQSADDVGELVTYCGPVGDHSVNPDVLVAVKASTIVACADLGIAQPDLVLFEKSRYPLRWMREHVPAAAAFECIEMRGIADIAQKIVGVNVDLSPAEAAETCAHELRHIAQGNPWSQAKERDALAYGERVGGLVGQYAKGRVPQVHRLHVEPSARASWLAGEVERGDLLLAGDAPVPYLNVGSRSAPDWWPLADLRGGG